MSGCACGLEYQISLLLLSSSSSPTYKRKRLLPQWQIKWIWKTPWTIQKGLFDNESFEIHGEMNTQIDRRGERGEKGKRKQTQDVDT